MPERRMDLKFNSLGETATEVKHLHEVGWERAGNWSLAQILEHLNVTLRMTMGEIPFFLPAPVRPLIKLAFMPTVRKGLPIRLRAIAPKSLQPGPSPDEREMVDRYCTLVDLLLTSETQFAPIHPVFGRVNRDEWLQIQTWHATHHLSFMSAVQKLALR